MVQFKAYPTRTRCRKKSEENANEFIRALCGAQGFTTTMVSIASASRLSIVAKLLISVKQLGFDEAPKRLKRVTKSFKGSSSCVPGWSASCHNGSARKLSWGPIQEQSLAGPYAQSTC